MFWDVTLSLLRIGTMGMCFYLLVLLPFLLANRKDIPVVSLQTPPGYSA